MTTPKSKALDAARGVVTVCDALADMVDTDLATFAADRRTQWAAEMGLIRIGEGINRIPAEVLDQYPDQPWRQMVAMRNFAAYQYDDLDPRRVWTTLTRDVPSLRSYLVDAVIPGLEGDQRLER